MRISTRRNWMIGAGGAALAVAADVIVVEPRWLSVEVKRVHIFGGKFKQPVRLL